MVRPHPQWLRTRTGRFGPDWPTAFRLGFLQLFQQRPLEHPQHTRIWWGRAHGHRMLPNHYVAVHVRRRAFPCVGLGGERSHLKVDRLTSAILDFPSGQSTFTCSTQLVLYQRSHFLGTRGRIEIEIPFNAPPDRLCRIFIGDGRDLFGGGIAIEEFSICD